MQTCWCCQDLLRACRRVQTSAEKLEQTVPYEESRMVSVPQSELLANTPETPLAKEQNHPSISLDGEGGKSQGERELRRGEREREIRAGAWEERVGFTQ